MMRPNAFFPSLDIGTDPAKIRDWAQAAEDLGYAYIEVPDHVFGAKGRDGWVPLRAWQGCGPSRSIVTSISSAHWRCSCSSSITGSADRIATRAKYLPVSPGQRDVSLVDQNLEALSGTPVHIISGVRALIRSPPRRPRSDEISLVLRCAS